MTSVCGRTVLVFGLVACATLGLCSCTSGGGSRNVVVLTGLALPDSNVVSVVVAASQPSTMYAMTDVGWVCRSTDGGTNWTWGGWTSNSPSSLIVDPHAPVTLYAGTGQGVFKSTDGASNWNAVNTGLTDLAVQAMAVDSSTTAVLYAGTAAGGVFKTTDGGGNWTACSSGLSELNVTALAVSPADTQTILAGMGSTGIYKSTDGGANWTAVSAAVAAVRALCFDIGSPSIAYAATDWPSYGPHGMLLKSTDGGSTWAVNGLPCGVDGLALASDPNRTGRIFGGTSGGGAFMTADGGASWAITEGTTYVPTVRSLAISKASSRVYAATDAGIMEVTIEQR